MANVYINGKRIVPAPLYSISHEINRTAGGVILSCLYNISLTGTILSDRGYPTSTGGFSTSADDNLDIIETGVQTQQQRFKSLLNKQAALKEQVLLEGTGYGSNKTVNIINTTGGAAGQTDDKIEFNFFASNIDFEPSTTTNNSNYVINFTANDVRLNNRSINPASGVFKDYNLRSANDSLNIERSNDRDDTIRVVRSVKAQGYKSYDADVEGSISASSGWQFAKEWVKTQFPADVRASPTTAVQGVPIVSFPIGYGYVGAALIEDVDKLEGSYGLTVTWTYAPINASGQYYAADEYTISRNTNRNGNKISYKISGNIKGFHDNTSKATAYDSAKTYFSQNVNAAALKTKIAAAYDNITGNILGPTVETSSHNNFAGTITYEYDFYQKFTSLPDCFCDFDLNVTKNEDERVIAEIPIPGRSGGPVIQDIKTRQTNKKSVSANFILTNKTSTFNIMPDLKVSGIQFLSDIGAISTGVSENTNFWKTGFSHNLDIIGGRYTMNFNYVEI